MIYLWAIAVAVLVTAVLSAAEMAFIAANRVRVRHLAETGDAVAARYLEAFRHPERMLSTAMMGVTIAHIAASSLATWALIPLAGGRAALLVTIALVPVMLVFGEVMPKTAARERATAMIRWLFPVLELATVVLAPVSWGARALVGKGLWTVGLRGAATRQFVSREELKLLLQLEPTEADVTSTEAEMIDKIFDLGDTAVREIMVPLLDVAALPEDATAADAIRLIQERGFSRIPIYADRELNMVGVVTAMDLLRRGAEVPDLKTLMRPATYAPETKRIDELLTELQKDRVQLAVVVDEYGAAVGIVTIEDIVEQIVGEIRDEHDRTPAAFERLPDGSYRVSGRERIEDLNDALDWSLPAGDFETVAGLVLATVHRLPRVGEEIQIDRHTFTILEADERRIRTVRITPPAGA
jgi:CBS domain containing-hemolysin-like protein